ncbi:nucleotide sugar dehydrogenase [Aminirod propionatiphilus]|uniref:Nucleotide sugar dehydrogenase n=2 Tax=Aminirod propionatiphilus TaxID=3415223 RepID=A0ACD1E064_9BACT|nr:nucleotide sugar dehydrogenase [Synergistota bacterium]
MDEKNFSSIHISVVGMGYIGLPTSTLFASVGFNVEGFDVNYKLIESLQKGRITIVEPHLQELFSDVLNKRTLKPVNRLDYSDIFIICVPTPFLIDSEGSKVADLSYIERASEMVGSKLKTGSIVVLESTVPPGTTMNIMSPILERASGLIQGKDFFVAHCPERVLPGNMLAELRRNDRIIGSSDPNVGQLLREIYGYIVTEGHIFITDDKTAELCKLVENTYRDINIAFANELSMICDDLSIDVHGLISLANHHPRVNIMNPGPGVGGHCLAVDPWFIVEKSPQKSCLIRQARKINEYKPEWIVTKIQERLYSLFSDRKDITLAIFGLAYKPDIDDLRESPSVYIALKLKKIGYQVIASEPNVDFECYKGIPLFSAKEALEKADFVIYSVPHSIFREFISEINLKNNFDITGTI